MGIYEGYIDKEENTNHGWYGGSMLLANMD